MEDFFSDGQVPLADFGSVSTRSCVVACKADILHIEQIVFTGASAKTNAGTTVDLKNATAINLVVDGKVSRTSFRGCCR